MTDTPDPAPAPPPAPVPIPPPPAGENDGLSAQDARALGLALGGGLTMFLAQSPVAPVAAAAIIPAFGVIAVWLYGRHQRRKLNRERLTLHAVISDLTGGLIR